MIPRNEKCKRIAIYVPLHTLGSELVKRYQEPIQSVSIEMLHSVIVNEYCEDCFRFKSFIEANNFSPVVKDVLMREGFSRNGFQKKASFIIHDDPRMRSDLKSYGTEWIKTEIWDKAVPLLVCKSGSDTRQCWNCHYLTVYNILLSYDIMY